LTLNNKQQAILWKMCSNKYDKVFGTIKFYIEKKIEHEGNVFSEIGPRYFAFPNNPCPPEEDMVLKELNNHRYTLLEISLMNNKELLKLIVLEPFWSVLRCEGCGKYKSLFLVQTTPFHGGAKCDDYEDHFSPYKEKQINLNFFEMRSKMLAYKKKKKLVDEKAIFGIEIIREKAEDTNKELENQNWKIIDNFVFDLFRFYELFEIKDIEEFDFNEGSIL